MGGEQSKQQLNWEKENITGLLERITKKTGIKENKDEEPRLKVIFIGPIGAGKSSLINCFLSVLKGENINIAISGGVDNVTDVYMEYPVYSEKGDLLDIAFYDCKGLGSSSGSLENDMLNAIFGEKIIGEQFSQSTEGTSSTATAIVRQEAAHVILYLANGHEYNECKRQNECNTPLSKIVEVKRKTDIFGIARYLLVTFMDKVDEKLLNDIRRITKSDKVSKIIDSIEHETKFQNGFVIPIANPSFNKPPTKEYRLYYLHLLEKIIKFADDIYEHRTYRREREQKEEGKTSNRQEAPPQKSYRPVALPPITKS